MAFNPKMVKSPMFVVVPLRIQLTLNNAADDGAVPHQTAVPIKFVGMVVGCTIGRYLDSPLIKVPYENHHGTLDSPKLALAALSDASSLRLLTANKAELLITDTLLVTCAATALAAAEAVLAASANDSALFAVTVAAEAAAEAVAASVKACCDVASLSVTPVP